MEAGPGAEDHGPGDCAPSVPIVMVSSWKKNKSTGREDHEQQTVPDASDLFYADLPVAAARFRADCFQSVFSEKGRAKGMLRCLPRRRVWSILPAVGPAETRRF